jgi:hypothetical protein
MQIKGVLQRVFERQVARLPMAYREGKMPYIVFFVTVVIAILLVYSAISPYHNATPLFLSMAAWLSLLLVLVNYGMPLSWGVHLGTAAGACVLAYAVWNAGGVFSPRLTWLLILPLTPFYVISRRSGLVWMLLVWLGQAAFALANHFGLVPPFEPGPEHALSSWVTFSLVTGMLIIVPLIYDRLQNMALKKSLRYQQEL